MFKWLREKLRPRLDHSVEDYPSVVLLLKDPQFQSAEEVLDIANRAWKAVAPVELLQTLDDGSSYILRCGKFWFAVHQAVRRYEVDGHEPNGLLQRPWDEHKAWLSIDLPMQRTAKLKEIDSLGGAYQLLLIYAFLFWSLNCLGVYFPAESITVPNLGGLADSINWSRKNGQNLDFLNTKKS
jgi:hypothetical protein